MPGAVAQGASAPAPAPRPAGSRAASAVASAVLEDGTTVGALVAVNAFGAPYDPATGELLALRHGLGERVRRHRTTGRGRPEQGARRPRGRGYDGAAHAPGNGHHDRRHRHGRDPHQGAVPEGQRARPRRARPGDQPGAHPARRRHALHPRHRRASRTGPGRAARADGRGRRLRHPCGGPRGAGRRVGHQRRTARCARTATPSPPLSGWADEHRHLRTGALPRAWQPSRTRSPRPSTAGGRRPRMPWASARPRARRSWSSPTSTGRAATHDLPGVVLAKVLGHDGSTATVPLTQAQLEAAVDSLAPAEACTTVEHPNLAAWRTVLGELAPTRPARPTRSSCRTSTTR